MNVPAIAALDVGLNFIASVGRERLEAHEMSLVCRAYDALASIPECRLYTARPDCESHVPLLSFNIGDIPSDEAGRLLGEREIAVRAGLHCAGEAHRAMGTQSGGTVRICPSVFTSTEEIDTFVQAVKEITNARGLDQCN